MAASPQLKKYLSGIRAECAKQGIDDDSRRTLMMRLAGVSSSTQLNLTGAKAVLDHLRKTGGPVRSRGEWFFTFRMPKPNQVFLKKIYRLAERIGKAQQPPVKVMPKKYIEGIATQMTGATAPLEFCDCDRLHKIVQALEVYVRRNNI